MGSTDQADPSCSYFRISWILMEQHKMACVNFTIFFGWIHSNLEFLQLEEGEDWRKMCFHACQEFLDALGKSTWASQKISPSVLYCCLVTKCLRDQSKNVRKKWKEKNENFQRILCQYLVNSNIKIFQFCLAKNDTKFIEVYHW